MLNFNYYNPARIVFGAGTIQEVGGLASAYGKKVLFHYGGGSIKKNGVYDQVIRSLQESNLDVVELPGVVPNPRLSLVREGIEVCKREKIDFILAVGGGSAIDSAKAIAFGARLRDDEDIWDDYYLRGNGDIKAAIPVGVVLTIPAAGSESSTGSVITDWDKNLKRAVNSETIIPRFAIMDPETNYSLPAYQTGCGVSDILAHLFERYFTNEQHNDLSDRFLESAMRNIIAYGPLALKHPDVYRYRAEIMWTGTVAHNNLLDQGRVGDWASHDIEHEISGIYDLAHGAGLSIVFPAWMKYVYKKHIDRFVQFATRVWDVDLTFDDKDLMVEVAIDKLENFYRSIGMPIRLGDAKIGDEKIRVMAQSALLGKTGLGSFETFTADDVEKILRLAL
ncbi:MAG TPA: iron-containing alcohol dehydrogenase [Sphaerochaeta sp.]|nr:iron-containing alcohol dehydrogenase [Sphaerochaeta sp.]HPK46929.1 iron-containing alcohol dehydrogenase [Sphaerochaeta sp.]